MKYDDASWHYGGDFPQGLPDSAGATHMTMFVAWAALNGLAGAIHSEEFADELALLKSHEATPVEWFLRVCDEKFTDEDLSDEGNAFARHYYGNEDGLHTKPGSYLADYDNAFLSCETLYHVPDGWSSFAVVDPIIRARFQAWKNQR